MIVTFADGPFKGIQEDVPDYKPVLKQGTTYQIARFAERDDMGNVWSVYLAFSGPVPNAITNGSYIEAPRVKRRVNGLP